jgi:hypothetical protein
MRSVVIAGLAAALALPAAGQAAIPPAEEQPPPREAPPAPQVDAPPDQAAPAPRVEPAAPEDRPTPEATAPEATAPEATPPDVSPWGDKLRPPEPEPKPKPKVKLDEAAGGVAGSFAAKVAGTAVAGPIGGIAASFVGGPVGSAAVRTGKRVLGIGRKPASDPAEARAEPVEQAAAAPDRGVPVAATERDPPEPALRTRDREEPAEPAAPAPQAPPQSR